MGEIITGECNHCGECCKDIQFDMRKPGQLFKIDLNEWLTEALGTFLKDNPGLDFSKVRTIRFHQVGDRVMLNVYGIECNNLEKKKNGKFICSVHGTDKFPQICAEYPTVNSKLPKKCGYKVVEDKKKNLKNLKIPIVKQGCSGCSGCKVKRK